MAEVNAACTSSTKEQGELGEGRRWGRDNHRARDRRSAAGSSTGTAMHRGGSRSTPSFPIVSYLLPQRAWEEDHPRTLCPALRCQFAPLQQLPEVQPPVQVPPALLNGALLLPLTGCCCEMVERPSLLLGVVDFLGRGDAALSWRRPSTHRDNAVREGKFEGDKHTARLSNLQRGTMKPLKDLFSRKKSEPKVNCECHTRGEV